MREDLVEDSCGMNSVKFEVGLSVSMDIIDLTIFTVCLA